MGQCADATAKLDQIVGCLEDRLDRCTIDRLAFECAVEIDDMQPLEPLILEGFSL